VTQDVSHEFQFPRTGTKVHRIALIPHALIETHRPWMEMHFSNIEANPDAARGAPVGPLKSWFSPYATGKMTGLRQYGYIGALVALTLALDDVEFLGAEEDQ
jgi:3-dehydroquinate dehydratase II